MQAVSKFNYNTLNKMLLGKTVHFKSDCEFFPNFDVTGRVMTSYIKGTELVFKFKAKNSKIIDIGSNMKNLRFDIVKG